MYIVHLGEKGSRGKFLASTFRSRITNWASDSSGDCGAAAELHNQQRDCGKGDKETFGNNNVGNNTSDNNDEDDDDDDTGNIYHMKCTCQAFARVASWAARSISRWESGNISCQLCHSKSESSLKNCKSAQSIFKVMFWSSCNIFCNFFFLIFFYWAFDWIL